MAEIFEIYWIKMSVTPLSLFVCGLMMRYLFFRMNRHFIPIVLMLIGIIASLLLFDTDHRFVGVLYGMGCAFIAVGINEFWKSVVSLCRLRYYRKRGEHIKLSISNEIDVRKLAALNVREESTYD
jgi:hypothetical protein